MRVASLKCVTLVSILCILSSGALAAGVVFLSATRFISADLVIDEVGSSPQEAHFSQDGPPDGIWSQGAFTVLMTGPRAFGGSEAQQVSSAGILRELGIVDVDAQPKVIYANADIQDPGFASTFTTESSSTLAISFTIAEAGELELFVSLYASVLEERVFIGGEALAIGQAGFELCGAIQGCFLRETVSDGRADGSSMEFTTTLERTLRADTYTFSIYAQTLAAVQEDAVARAEASFATSLTVVPEPAAGTLSAVAILVLVALRHRRVFSLGSL